jgi:UMF1 family MFS transporter
LFGVLGERIGTRNALLIGLAVYMFVTAWASYITSSWEFYVLAVTIGLVQGGVQALSRSWYARLIPKDKAAEFFGFYNMLGKAAAVLGPVMVGWVSVATGSHRVAILSLLLLFIAGTLLLLRVPTEFEENHHE